MFFKVMQYGYETFQNVAPILDSVIYSEMKTGSVTNNRLLKKERRSYKFMFSLETITFNCRKILQLRIWSFLSFKLWGKYK